MTKRNSYHVSLVREHVPCALLNATMTCRLVERAYLVLRNVSQRSQSPKTRARAAYQNTA